MKTWMGVAIACTCSIVSVYCLSSTNSIQLNTQTCKRWWTSFVAALQQCRDGNVIGLIGIGQAGYIVAFTIFYIFSDYISHHIFRLPSSSPKCACFIGSLDMSNCIECFHQTKDLFWNAGRVPENFGQMTGVWPTQCRRTSQKFASRSRRHYRPQRLHCDVAVRWVGCLRPVAAPHWYSDCSST